MSRSGRYSDINVPVNFPVRTKFMPYPHKNSDGVIPKKVEPDIWDIIKPPTSKEFTQMLKGVGYYPTEAMNAVKKLEGATSFMTMADKQKYVAQLKAHGLLPKDWEYKEDPILIPATEVKKWFWEPGDPVVAPMHSVVDLTVYTNMPGLAKNHNKVGASWVIDPTHDYTESEIRARLQQGFKAMEELIIKSLKENKK